MDFYYNARGDRVSLVRVPDVYAVRFAPGERSDSAALSPASQRFLCEDSTHIDFLPHYGLQIFRLKPAAASRQPAFAAPDRLVESSLRALNQEPSVHFAAPVFRYPGSDDPVYVSNQFVVEFKPGVTESQAQAIHSQYGVRIVERLGYAQDGLGYVLETPPTAGPLGAIELSKRYFESGLVRYANPDLIRRRAFRHAVAYREDDAATRSDAGWRYADEQWHLQKAGVIEAWQEGTGDPRITICIADDGVDVAHPAFAGRLGDQYDFESNVPDALPKTDLDNHGTACAGVAAAAGPDVRGAAPQCTLMAVRTPAFLGTVDEGRMFQWIADHKADVLSCSWGPPDNTGDMPLTDNVASAIHYCVTRGRDGKGIPIVWAAGNGNELVSGDGYASNPEVMAIAASTDRDTKAYYSDYGPEIWICAPSSGRRADGERQIWTVDRQGAAGYNNGDAALGDPDGDYTNAFGGTSSAAPLVAGVAALMLSANPELRWTQVRDVLKASADKIGAASEYDANGHSAKFGFGRLHAARAVALARGTQGAGAPPAPSAPRIAGPPRVLRTDGPPEFTCSGSDNPYYAVEVASDALLFDRAHHSAERTPDNFFATWQAGLSSAPTYALAADAWDRLKCGDRLYYRLISSANASRWVNSVATTPDARAAEAPWIDIASDAVAEPPASAPFIQGPSSIERSGPAPRFVTRGGRNPYYAVEVAADPGLFKAARAADCREDNFYATWQDGPLLTAPEFTLPPRAWTALSAADRLYYRLISSASGTAWEDMQATTPETEAERAPYVSVVSAPSLPVARFSARSAAVADDDLVPIITSSETYDRASLLGPTFLVMTGANHYYAIEVVTDPMLWDTMDRASRSPRDVFASWTETPLQRANRDGDPTTFTLPQAAWQQLVNGERLFYRVITSADAGTWSNVQRSYPTGRSLAPPFIRLKGRAGARRESVRYRSEERLWREDRDPR